MPIKETKEDNIFSTFLSSCSSAYCSFEEYLGSTTKTSVDNTKGDFNPNQDFRFEDFFCCSRKHSNVKNETPQNTSSTDFFSKFSSDANFHYKKVETWAKETSEKIKSDLEEFIKPSRDIVESALNSPFCCCRKGKKKESDVGDNVQGEGGANGDPIDNGNRPSDFRSRFARPNKGYELFDPRSAVRPPAPQPATPLPPPARGRLPVTQPPAASQPPAPPASQPPAPPTPPRPGPRPGPAAQTPPPAPTPATLELKFPEATYMQNSRGMRHKPLNEQSEEFKKEVENFKKSKEYEDFQIKFPNFNPSDVGKKDLIIYQYAMAKKAIEEGSDSNKTITEKQNESLSEFRLKQTSNVKIKDFLSDRLKNIEKRLGHSRMNIDPAKIEDKISRLSIAIKIVNGGEIPKFGEYKVPGCIPSLAKLFSSSKGRT